MSAQSIFDRALALASAAHAGQTDKAGHPYILHPCAVAAAVADHGEIAMAVALLHDVVEDTPITIEEIEKQFGPSVAGPVGLLTKPAGGADYGDYLNGIVTDPVAALVKLADMRHNLGRVDQLDDDSADLLRKKYGERIPQLEAAVGSPVGREQRATRDAVDL